MLSVTLEFHSLYSYMHSYLYLFNVYLFLYLQLFYRDSAKFNKCAIILAFVMFICLYKFKII